MAFSGGRCVRARGAAARPRASASGLGAGGNRPRHRADLQFPVGCLPRATGGQQADPELVKAAARRIVFAAVVVGLLWSLAQAIFGGAARRVEARVANWLRRGEATLAAGLVAIALVGGVLAVGDPVGKLEEQYDDFVNLRRRRRRYAVPVGRWLPLRLLAGRLARVRGRSAARTGCRQLRRSLPASAAPPRTSVNRTVRPRRSPSSAWSAWPAPGCGGSLRGPLAPDLSSRERARAPHSCGGRRRDLRGVARPHERRLLHNIPGVTGVALCAAAALVAPMRHVAAVVDFEANRHRRPHRSGGSGSRGFHRPDRLRGQGPHRRPRLPTN